MTARAGVPNSMPRHQPQRVWCSAGHSRRPRGVLRGAGSHPAKIDAAQRAGIVVRKIPAIVGMGAGERGIVDSGACGNSGFVGSAGRSRLLILPFVDQSRYRVRVIVCPAATLPRRVTVP